MSDLHWKLQAAIKPLLDAALSAIGVPVYDGAPESAALPLVDIGDTTAQDWSDKTGTGQDIDMTVHVYSDYQGKKQVLAILGAIHTALHCASISIAGGTVVQARFESSQIFTDADPRVRHGIARYRFLVS